MIRSMTGYGRGEAVVEGYRAVAELKAVNHRYTEINVRMSRDLLAFEDHVKKKITERIRRGRVEAYISFERITGSLPVIEVNQQLAREIKLSGDKLAAELGIEPVLPLAQLLQFEGVMQLKAGENDPVQVEQILSIALVEAVDNLTDMRTREGEQLASDFRDRLGKLSDLISLMEARSPHVIMEYRERLQRRMQEWLNGKVELEESRFLTEVALFSERANVDEELVRLRSHILQFENTLQLNEPVGRKLDFLVQEMNRETNTIGSKANDFTLAQYVVEAKSLLEQIREQVQNVE